jgi:hypothetical protein
MAALTNEFCDWLTALTNEFCDWLTALTNEFCDWLTALTNEFCDWLTALTNEFCDWLTALTNEILLISLCLKCELSNQYVLSSTNSWLIYVHMCNHIIICIYKYIFYGATSLLEGTNVWFRVKDGVVLHRERYTRGSTGMQASGIVF